MFTYGAHIIEQNKIYNLPELERRPVFLEVCADTIAFLIVYIKLREGNSNPSGGSRSISQRRPCSLFDKALPNNDLP